jgi:ATP/maltotriose-dependent transcriptional regulator MalT
MENVFDIATPEELIDLFGEDEPDLSEEFRNYALEREAAQRYPESDANYINLALLYAGRGDLKKADTYLARIQDTGERLGCQLLIYERVD